MLLWTFTRKKSVESSRKKNLTRKSAESCLQGQNSASVYKLAGKERHFLIVPGVTVRNGLRPSKLEPRDQACGEDLLLGQSVHAKQVIWRKTNSRKGKAGVGT